MTRNFAHTCLSFLRKHAGDSPSNVTKTTSRKELRADYPSDEAFNDRLRRVREYRSTHAPPFDIPLPDYSSPSLDTPYDKRVQDVGGRVGKYSMANRLRRESISIAPTRTNVPSVAAHEATHRQQMSRLRNPLQRFLGIVPTSLLNLATPLDKDEPYLSQPIEMDARAAEIVRRAEQKVIDPITGKLFRVNDVPTARRLWDMWSRNRLWTTKRDRERYPDGLPGLPAAPFEIEQPSNRQVPTLEENIYRYDEHEKLREYMIQRMPFLVNTEQESGRRGRVG